MEIKKEMRPIMHVDFIESILLLPDNSNIDTPMFSIFHFEYKLPLRGKCSNMEFVLVFGLNTEK